MDNETKFLKALVEMNSDFFNEKDWLINNFELYKQTLNWPSGLPPINRNDLKKGTLKEKFNTTFDSVLHEYEYVLDNNHKTIVILDKYSDMID